MLDTSYSPVLPRTGGPLLTRCPACGHRGLWAISTPILERFVCSGCRSCWHFDGGLVRRMDPVVCPGCPSRAICTGPART